MLYEITIWLCWILLPNPSNPVCQIHLAKSTQPNPGRRTASKPGDDPAWVWFLHRAGSEPGPLTRSAPMASRPCSAGSGGFPRPRPEWSTLAVQIHGGGCALGFGADHDHEPRHQVAARLSRYTRPLPASFSDVTVRPSFLPNPPDIKPRALCDSQPVAAMMVSMVAPSGA